MKRVFTAYPVAIRQHTEPCGCVVTERPGHVHTELCDTHRDEIFKHRGQIVPGNLDMIMPSNLDLIGG